MTTQTAKEAHKADTGSEIRLTVQDGGTAVDLTGATTLTIKLKKPSGTVVSKTATVVGDATAGVIRCYTAATDLDEVGLYEIQPYLVLASGWTGHGDRVMLRVHGVISS